MSWVALNRQHDGMGQLRGKERFVKKNREIPIDEEHMYKEFEMVPGFILQKELRFSKVLVK